MLFPSISNKKYHIKVTTKDHKPEFSEQIIQKGS